MTHFCQKSCDRCDVIVGDSESIEKLECVDYRSNCDTQRLLEKTLKLPIKVTILFSKEMSQLSQNTIRFAVTQSDQTVQGLDPSALLSLQNAPSGVLCAKRL